MIVIKLACKVDPKIFGKKITSTRVDKNMKGQKHVATIYPLHLKANQHRSRSCISTNYIHELIYYSEANSFIFVFWGYYVCNCVLLISHSSSFS